MSTLPKFEGTSYIRWLLLGSLALNLFFVGAAGAVAFRYSSPVPLMNVARIRHNVADRLDRIAASLPANDADIMRTELRAGAAKIAAAQADLLLSQDEMRTSLRADPFNADAVRAAMDQNRAAHENFEQVLHDIIASAAAKMSVVGRNKLADWPTSTVNDRSPPR